MNNFGVRVRPAYGGFIGQVRKVHKAAFEDVCCDGEPVIHQTRAEAELAAWRVIGAHLDLDIVGTGVTASQTAAEKLFPALNPTNKRRKPETVFPGKGRPPFKVERR
jgi:hypothetical protein